jgi:hydrogenase maturation factor
VIFLFSLGFNSFKVDTSLFVLSVGVDIFYLLVCVDDILLTGNDFTMLYHLIQLLSLEFKLHDLDVVYYFLGFEVQFTSMGLMLRQHKYILDILTRADMTSCKLVDTLISTSKVTVLSDFLLSDPT